MKVVLEGILNAELWTVRLHKNLRGETQVVWFLEKTSLTYIWKTSLGSIGACVKTDHKTNQIDTL